jgi:hypothetical protein
MKSYELGDQLVLGTVFTDPATGLSVDPTTVTGELRSPKGVVYMLAVTHPSLGLYKALYTPTIAGVWTCRWVGTGAVVAANEFRFEVRPSVFLT